MKLRVQMVFPWRSQAETCPASLRHSSVLSSGAYEKAVMVPLQTSSPVETSRAATDPMEFPATTRLSERTQASVKTW